MQNKPEKKIICDIPVDRFTQGTHIHQRRVLWQFEQGRRFFWLNWHRRARKTTLCLNLLLREAATQKNRTYDYIAPTYKQAKSIVWRDPNMLNCYLPDIARLPWQKNESELFVYFKETNSYLFIKGADNPDSLRGTAAHGVAFDEFALIDPSAWYEVYRPIVAEDVTKWAAFLFTPKGMNHAYDMIQLAEANDEAYVSTLPASTSGLISKEELEKARQEMPAELFMQEFECSFIAEEEMTFITSAGLAALEGLPYVEDKPRTFISVDPATGGDECVAKAFRNIKEIEMKIYRERDEMKLVAELDIFARQLGTKNFVIETVGLGGPIASRLREMGNNVFNYEPGGKATDSDRFANSKAEMWWEVGRAVRDKKVEYPEDTKTRQQLSSVKYKLQSSSGKLICEPKDLTKKRIGHSPDRADAWVIGMFHWQNFEPDGKPQRISGQSSYAGLGIG